ncbi:hypothetical protein Moror_5469, partial [Moniliophthora roreri MCA 2997]
TLTTHAVHCIVGTIELCIFRVRVKHREAHINRKAHQDRLLDEKSVKGIQHQTTFGEAVTGESRDAVRVDQLSPSPIARFCFQYRPIDMLQAEGIAPKSNITQQRVDELTQDQKPKKEEPCTKRRKGPPAVSGSLGRPILILDDEDSLPTPQSPPPFHARTRSSHCSVPKKEEPHTETLFIPNDGSSKDEPIIIDDDDMVVEVIPSFPPPNPSSPASPLTIEPEPTRSSSAHGFDPKREDGALDKLISVADPPQDTKSTRDPRLSASSKRARIISHDHHGARLRSTDIKITSEDMEPSRQTLALDLVNPNSSPALQGSPSFSNHQANLADSSSVAEPQHRAEQYYSPSLQDDPKTISLRARLSKLQQSRFEREQEAKKKLERANMNVTGT